VEWRGRIVLATADGAHAIFKTRACRKSACGADNDRVEEGAEGLLRDETRPPPGKSAVGDGEAQRAGQDGSETRPNATHWRATDGDGGTHISLQPISAEAGLKPYLVRRSKISKDPQFEEKLTDVVVLNLNLPDCALMLCVDEKR
jgi:hypothetical protein